MRVLVVDAFVGSTNDQRIAETVIAVLEKQGNAVDYLSLESPEFAGFMTATERDAYVSDKPLVSSATKDAAMRLQAADAVLFVYPTTLFGVPSVLKSWFERVMVQGVSFVFDSKNRVRPALTNVRRLGAVTTTPHSRMRTVRARNLGYLTIMRGLRLSCHRLCRRTFVRLDAAATPGRIEDQLQRSLRGWR